MIAPDGTLYIDNSTLKAVARCSTEALVRYGFGYVANDDESAPLRAGTDAHEALADYFRGQPADVALATFEHRYAPWADEHIDPNGPQARFTFLNLYRILTQWFATHPLHTLPFAPQPDFVEIGFAYPLDDHIIFCGRLDALVTDRERGDFYVLDHKTTGRLDLTWARSFRQDSQISGYVWAAEQTLKQPVMGAFLNGIEFSKLPSDPTRRCREHGVVYAECGLLHARSEIHITQRTPEQLERWRTNALVLAHRFRRFLLEHPDLTALTNVPTEGIFHGACNWCQFNDFCAVGRPTQYATTMLTKNEWKPYDYAFPELDGAITTDR